MSGRPEGWRKPDARRHSIMVRVHKDERKAIKKRARKKRMTTSEYIRWLFYRDHPPLRW